MRSNPILFLVIFLGVLFLIDLYTAKGIKVLVQNVDQVALRRAALIAHWAVYAIIVVWVLVAVLNYPWMSNYKHYKFYYYLFGLIILFYIPKILFSLFIFADDISYGVQFVLSKLKPASPADPVGEQLSRRMFLYQAGAVVATIPFLGAAYGMIKGRFDFKVVRKTITASNFPSSFNGLRVVQISDAHLGSFFDNKKPVQKAFDSINALEPDLILFTGDMVNNYSIEAENWIDSFKGLKAKLGKFAIVGNHDYGDYSSWPDEQRKQANFDRLIEIEQEMGFEVLLNQNKVLERNGEKLAIIGVENWGIKPFPQKGDVQKAKSGAEEAPYKILMSHDPSHWDEIVLKEHSDIDITLSGHTHGAQFGVQLGNIKWSPVKYKYPRWAGMYEEGNQKLYVNRGFGYIGFPGRVGMPPEITCLEFSSI
ncbi:MAG TPA: metallophosphatase [Flavobacteriales bacterium]|jgi:predicted MPP superfamily phosphohydrolase|nr:metallophosphatase [Flavobacteriales bacterium]